jgi:hypothetical protein
MDLTEYATQDKAEAGEWFTIFLYGKATEFQLKILGSDSDAVQKFNRAQMKKVPLNAGKVELDDETLDRVLESNDEGVIVRIAGIRGLQFDKKHKEILGYEPVTLEGKELKDDKQSYQFLIEKIPAVKDFVLKVSGDRVNFTQGKKNA